MEVSLLSVSADELENIDRYLINWDRNYGGESDTTFDLDGAIVQVVHFLLSGSSDIANTWSADSKQLISEVFLPNYGDTVLVDALAGGTWLKSLHSQGLVATCLSISQVQEVAQGLAKITQENLELRWDALNQRARSDRLKVIGSLEELLPDPKRLEQVVWDVEEFSDFLVNQFAAYYANAANEGSGIVVLDCT